MARRRAYPMPHSLPVIMVYNAAFVTRRRGFNAAFVTHRLAFEFSIRGG